MPKTSITGNMPKKSSLVGFIQKRTNTTVEIIAALFILLFLYTALSKTLKIDSTINTMTVTPFFSKFSEVTAWTIVISEYVVAFLLFAPRTRKAGLYFSFGLMAIFTIYIAWMKIFIPKLPCSCGGVISKMTWNQHLIFNIFFTILALVGILLSKK